MIYNYDDNLRYHDDVKNKFGFANINAFPKNFDIKNINENLNVCDCCGDICNWHDEMFWQGEECSRTNVILGDYVAVCDICFDSLRSKKL